MAKRHYTGLRKKPNGRYELRFYVGEKQFSVSGASKKECEERAAERREEIKNGLYTENRNITLSAYFEEYLRKKRGEILETTEMNHRTYFTRVNKALGHYKVISLEPRQIDAFRDDLEREINDSSSRLTAHGANRILELLSSVLEEAIRDRIIAYNPAVGARRFKRTGEKAVYTIHRRLTEDELARFFEAAAGSYYFNLYEFMLNSGARCGGHFT